MIPLLAVVDVRGHRPLKVWLPLFAIWILLLPVVLVALPFALLSPSIVRGNSLRAAAALWSVLATMRGTHVEVATNAGSVLVRVY